MLNEFIFIIELFFCGLGQLAALYLGKEALSAFICTNYLLANLFVTKQIVLFGLTVTASDALAVSGMIGTNLVQEYFGKKTAQNTVIISFLIIIFVTIFSGLLLLLIPAAADTMQPHLSAVFQTIPRITAASLFTFFVAQRLDIFLYGKIRAILPDAPVVSSCISVGISQFIDTALFTYLGLWGIIANPFEVILVSFTIKIVALASATPCLYIAKLLISKSPQIV